MIDAQRLADDYVAVWNERESVARRSAIAKLWPPTGKHYVRSLEVLGYEDLEKRVTSSHEKKRAGCGYVFRAVKNAQQTCNVVTFNWEMIRPAGEEVAAVGLEFLQIGTDGRIAADYQFIVS